jgi:exosortase
MRGATRDRIGGEPAWTQLIAAYAVFAAGVVFLTLPTSWDMARTWISSSAYHHGLFVAPAAIWMIVAHSWRPEHDSGRRASLAIVAFAAAVWLAGRAGGASLVEQIGFVSMLIGGAGAAFGDRALTLWAWPLAFLFFMVPAGESILPALQFITANIAVALLTLSGVSVQIDGILIKTRIGAFAIAEACAGLRLLTAALMVAAIFAYVGFEKWWKRIAFLSFTVVFAILANALRAYFLILIPVLTNTPASVGPDHFVIGWILYLGVLVVLALLGRRFADRRATARPMTPSPPLRPLLVAGAVGVVIASAAYAHAVVMRPLERPTPASTPVLSAEGWRILPAPANWSADFPHADAVKTATYDQNGARVYASFGFFTHDRRGAEIAGGENRSHEEGDWRLLGQHEAVLYLFGASETRRFEKLAGPENRRLLALTV